MDDVKTWKTSQLLEEFLLLQQRGSTSAARAAIADELNARVPVRPEASSTEEGNEELLELRKLKNEVLILLGSAGMSCDGIVRRLRDLLTRIPFLEEEQKAANRQAVALNHMRSDICDLLNLLPSVPDQVIYERVRLLNASHTARGHETSTGEAVRGVLNAELQELRAFKVHMARAVGADVTAPPTTIRNTAQALLQRLLTGQECMKEDLARGRAREEALEARLAAVCEALNLDPTCTDERLLDTARRAGARTEEVGTGEHPERQPADTAPYHCVVHVGWNDLPDAAPVLAFRLGKYDWRTAHNGLPLADPAWWEPVSAAKNVQKGNAG